MYVSIPINYFLCANIRGPAIGVWRTAPPIGGGRAARICGAGATEHKRMHKTFEIKYKPFGTRPTGLGKTGGGAIVAPERCNEGRVRGGGIGGWILGAIVRPIGGSGIADVATGANGSVGVTLGCSTLSARSALGVSFSANDCRSDAMHSVSSITSCAYSVSSSYSVVSVSSSST
jgi:hypothetical protein